MRLLAPLFTALFFLGISTSQAEVSEYDIEIVIFEDLSNRYIDSELWPRVEHALPLDEKTPHIITEQQLDVAAAYPGNNDVINIAHTSRVMLKQYAEKLEKSGRYHVLVHKAWRQAGLDAESAIDMQIDSNMDSQTGRKPATIEALRTTMTGTENYQDDEPGSSVSGKVKIILGRYLHIYTDLIYKKPAASHEPIPVSLADSRYSEFQIKNHRRMRSKELHYLDHPLVGMLVMAWPVEPAEKNASQMPTQ